MNTPKLFVALSHTLTQSQIDGFTAQYGKEKYELNEDGNIIEGSYYPATTTTTIVTLKEVAPELQAQMSNIPATATLAEIQQLAKAIVAEAVKAGATHFCLQGEPCLQIWANLMAHGECRNNEWKDGDVVTLGGNRWSVPLFDDSSHFKTFKKFWKMTCIQSTTERVSVETMQPDGSVVKTATFNHVQWRELF